MIANAVTVTATWLATHTTRLELCAEAVDKNINSFLNWSGNSDIDDLSDIVNNTITNTDTEITFEFGNNTTVTPSTDKVPGKIVYTIIFSLESDTHTITGEVELPIIPASEWKYNVTINGSNATTNGTGKYLGGTTVTIDAGTVIGKRFNGWVVDDNVTLNNVNDDVTTFVMPLEDVVIEASFVDIDYTVTMDEHCDTAKAPDSTYNYGETVEITCVNDKFVEWSCDDPTVVFADKTNAITTFAMPANNITIDHTFSTYDVTVNNGGEGVTGAGSYAPGATVTIVAGTKGGYEFSDFSSDITIDSITKPNATTITFTMPQDNVVITGAWVALLQVVDGVVTGTAALKAKAVGSVDLVIPNAVDGQSITSIGLNAFFGYDSLKTVVITDAVAAIGKYAFQNCHNITSITLPSALTVIDAAAFNNCDALTSITIPNVTRTINENAFANCDVLASVTLPASIETVNATAFNGCTVLKEIDVNKTSGSLAGAPWGATGAKVKWAKYQLTVTSSGVGSTGNGSYAPGASVSVNAGTFTPPVYFNGWTNMPAGGDANAVGTTFVMPENDVALTANSVNKYNVTVTGSTLPNDQNGSGLYATGTTVTVKAGEPAAGMRFVGWECPTNNVTPL